MEFTQEVRKATDPIYQKISKVMPEIEWSIHAPYIHKINKLKKELQNRGSADLEVKIATLEKEVDTLKAVLQYQMRNKKK